MKKKIALLLISLWAVAAFCAVKDGSEELSRHTEELSQQLLIADLERTMKEFAIPEEAFFARLKAEETALTDPAVAIERGKALYAELLIDEFNRQFSALADTFAVRPQSLPVLPPEVIESHYQKQFPPLYAKLRARLVQEQQQLLTTGIYPTEEELDTCKDEQLANLLTERIQAAVQAPLFAENQAFIRGQLVAPILQSARAQQAWQLQFIQGVPIPQSGLPETVGPYLVNQLEEALRQRAAQKPQEKNYAIFQRSRDAIAARAQGAILEHLKKGIGDYQSAESIDSLRQKLLDDPAKFLSVETMTNRVFADFAAQAREFATEAALANAPEAERSALGGQMRIISDDVLAPFVRQNFNQQLAGLLSEARKQAVAAQLHDRFADLNENRWLPQETAVTAWFQGGPAPWLDAAGLDSADRTPDAAPLFPEVAEAATRQLQAAFEAARHDLEVQMQLVPAAYESVKAQLLEQQKQEKERQAGMSLVSIAPVAGSSVIEAPPIETIVQTYTQTVSSQWQAQKDTPLCALTRDEIQVYSEALRSELIQSSGVNVTRPEEIELSPVEVPLLITLSRPQEDIEITLASESGIPEQTLRCPTRLSDYRRVEPEVLKQVSSWVAERLLAAQGAERPVKLKIGIEVKDGWIYYRFISRLREEIAARIGDQAESDISDKMAN